MRTCEYCRWLRV